jgi:hypothetical protein
LRRKARSNADRGPPNPAALIFVGEVLPKHLFI